MKEPELIKQIQLRASKLGARLFRNSVGKGWQGKAHRIEREETYRLYKGDVIIRKARRVEYGLCIGSADTVGWIPVKITEDMVNQTFAIFFAAEVKARGTRVTKEQQDFITAVNLSGGRACIIRDDPAHIDSEILNIKITAGGKL